MTREKQPAAPSAACRAASLLTGALMAVALSGCSGGGLFQIGDADTSLGQKARPSVALSPVQGVPQKYAAKANEQFASSVKSKGVQVVEAKDAQYIVKVSYVAVPEPKHGTKIAYTIDVTDKAGNKVRSITGEELVSDKRGGDSWSHVTEEAVQKIALKSAGDVNAWIDNPNAAPPQAVAQTSQPAAPVKTAARTTPKPQADKPQADKQTQAPSMAAAVDSQATAPARPVQQAAAAPAPREVVAIVTSVAGAPGDGKTALAEAMKRALGKQGVKLAANAAPGLYKVQGQVELGAAVNGEQPITIRWVVVDPAGKQIDKTVVQSNKIAAGSLDKAWGDIADLVAGPAAAEVSKLLNKTAAPPAGQAQQQTPGSAG